MPRARNIKHSFFVSEQVADNCPMGRLLFIGLWTIADYKGNLLWKPRTIKAQLFPFDECDLESLAINLDKSGLIRFYSVDGSTYVNIPGFLRHQNPHKNEKAKPSEVPDFTAELSQPIENKRLANNPDKSRLNHDENWSIPADSCFLIADSLSLNPDHLNPESSSQPPAVCVDASQSSPAAKRAAKPKQETKGAETWGAYSNAYYSRYGVDPVRNAKINSMITQLVDRLGEDDAPHVAAFYIHHSNSFYVANGHSVGMLLRDAEKLRTEWATGRKVTQTMARQVDRTASNAFANMLTAQEQGNDRK
jgi:hypothetical protein